VAVLVLVLVMLVLVVAAAAVSGEGAVGVVIHGHAQGRHTHERGGESEDGQTTHAWETTASRIKRTFSTCKIAPNANGRTDVRAEQYHLSACAHIAVNPHGEASAVEVQGYRITCSALENEVRKEYYAAAEILAG
jgi:hypothetical protein